MVTKSMSKTPFGTKLVYKADGECIWSEYVSTGHTSRRRGTASKSKNAPGFLGFLWAGFRSAWSAKSA